MVKASVNTIRYMIQELRQMIDSLEQDLPETKINVVLSLFTKFFDETIITIEVPKEYKGSGGLKLDDVYFGFLEWSKQNLVRAHKTPSRKELRYTMEFKFGKPNPGNIWPNLTFKNEDCQVMF